MFIEKLQHDELSESKFFEIKKRIIKQINEINETINDLKKERSSELIEAIHSLGIETKGLEDKLNIELELLRKELLSLKNLENVCTNLEQKDFLRILLKNLNR